ncbi:hypothetical protein N9L68_00800 [bacterium]|nr:hypothetical protein [bacterium]
MRNDATVLVVGSLQDLSAGIRSTPDRRRPEARPAPGRPKLAPPQAAPITPLPQPAKKARHCDNQTRPGELPPKRTRSHDCTGISVGRERAEAARESGDDAISEEEQRRISSPARRNIPDPGCRAMKESRPRKSTADIGTAQRGARLRGQFAHGLCILCGKNHRWCDRHTAGGH